MNAQQQLCYPPRQFQTSTGGVRDKTHVKASSSPKAFAGRHATTQQESNMSRRRAYTTPANITSTTRHAIANNGSLFHTHQTVLPGTPAPTPSPSDSGDLTPQSLRHRSPITPTFFENQMESYFSNCSTQLKSRPPRSGREIEKRNISYPIPSPTYSTVPFALDIKVDEDAYQPHRKPPRPEDPLPRSLETSYLEWDDSSSKLDKVMKNMRLVRHAHCKQTSPDTMSTTSYRYPDIYVNATPRTPPHLAGIGAKPVRHQRQGQSLHVSNFSRPTGQRSPTPEKRSRQPDPRANHVISPHSSESQAFLPSNMESQDVRPTQKLPSTSQPIQASSKDDLLIPRRSAPASERNSRSPPLKSKVAVVDHKISAQYLEGNLDRSPEVPAGLVHNQHVHQPTFYTYHVTRRIDTSKPFGTNPPSYPYPSSDIAMSYSSVRQPRIASSRSSSQKTEDQILTVKNRLVRNIVQGMSRKSSMSTVQRKRAVS